MHIQSNVNSFIFMLQATRTSAISYSFAFAALFIATTFAMSQIVHNPAIHSPGIQIIIIYDFPGPGPTRSGCHDDRPHSPTLGTLEACLVVGVSEGGDHLALHVLTTSMTLRSEQSLIVIRAIVDAIFCVESGRC